MSISEVDAMTLMRSIGAAGMEIPLNDCKELTVAGLCTVIEKLSEKAREARAREIFETARSRQQEWLAMCHMNDATNWKNKFKESQEEVHALEAKLQEAQEKTKTKK